MSWVLGLVLVLIASGSALAIATSSIGRMTRVHVASLVQEGRRNAVRLEEIVRAPAPYLHAIALAAMFVQNGAAILVAMLAQRVAGDPGIALVCAGFTLLYFLVVEAIAKRLGIVHGDRAALVLAPVVWLFGLLLALPTRALIDLGHVLVPGRRPEPVSLDEIHQLAELGHEEGVIAEVEKNMIQAVLHLGGMLVRETMVPRPDIVGIEVTGTIRDAHALAVKHRFTRFPVYRGDLDHTEGIVHTKDILAAVFDGRNGSALTQILRPAHFVPDSKRAATLLAEMQRQKYQLSLVVDEYGSVSGLVTLEDLLAWVVGNIAEDHVPNAADVEALGKGRYRLDASVGIHELNELLGVDLPRDRWNTVGGLMFGLLGAIPSAGQSVATHGLRFTAEKVVKRRVASVLVTPESAGDGTQ